MVHITKPRKTASAAGLQAFDKWKELAAKFDPKKINFPTGLSFLASGKVLVSYSIQKNHETFNSMDEALGAILEHFNIIK